MTRLIPHPLLTLWLWLMWMVLTHFSLGQALLGGALALFAGHAMAALTPNKLYLRNWRVIPRLIWTVYLDIIRSNIAVTKLILQGKRSARQPAFLQIPLALRDHTGLAVLSIILTATPGTAWVEYTSETGILILHVFDATEEEKYRQAITTLYVPMLQELFE